MSSQAFDTEVAIIGAGPYGLSLAAHLAHTSTEFLIFGEPMDTWTAHMPSGMRLKSEGRASSLSDPGQEYTLKRFCQDHGIEYQETGWPVPIEVFTDYGLWFQRSLVPTLDPRRVAKVDAASPGFQLLLETGEAIRARRVVTAAGGTYFSHKPSVLDHFPKQLVSHSSEHHDLGSFGDKDVTVIGGGQSALESAALLSEAGTTVRLLVRKPSLGWNPPPHELERPLPDRVFHPTAALGIGWRPWFYSNGSTLFHRLPRPVRLWTVDTALGPAGAWWLKDRVTGHFPVAVGCRVAKAEIHGERIRLRLMTGDEGSEVLETDHVIAATGYRVDVGAFPFLASNLRSAAPSAPPRLSPDFESEVPGLYFIGLASAYSFGPAMRFVYGAGYTARRLAQHFTKVARRGRKGVGHAESREGAVIGI